ncbi:hypothetical protein Tco_0245934 [Tanacetum coccineum]
MLEKDMYDSWKSRMDLYMMNRQHGRMILESVENGPLTWPSMEENKVTRPKKYSELSATESIQANCDIKATGMKRILKKKAKNDKLSTGWKRQSQSKAKNHLTQQAHFVFALTKEAQLEDPKKKTSAINRAFCKPLRQLVNLRIS